MQNRVAMAVGLGGQLPPWGSRHGSSRSIRVALGPTGSMPAAAHSAAKHDAAASFSNTHHHRAAPDHRSSSTQQLQQQSQASGSSEAHTTPSRRPPPTPPPPPCTSRASSTVAPSSPQSTTQSQHAQSPPWSSEKAGVGIRDGISIRQQHSVGSTVGSHHSPFVVGAPQGGGAGVHAVYQTTQPHVWQPFVPPSVPSVTIFHDFADAAEVEPHAASNSAISVAIAGQGAAAAAAALASDAAPSGAPTHANHRLPSPMPPASSSAAMAAACASPSSPAPPDRGSNLVVQPDDDDDDSDDSPPPTPSSVALSAASPTARGPSRKVASWRHSSPLCHSPPYHHQHSTSSPPLSIHSMHSPPFHTHSPQSLATPGGARGKRAQSWSSNGSWQASSAQGQPAQSKPRQVPSWRPPPRALPPRPHAAVIQPNTGAETQLVVRATLAYRQAPTRPSGPPPPPRAPRRAWADVWAEDEEKRRIAREKATLRDHLRRGLCRGRPSTAAQMLRQDALLRAPPPSPKPHQQAAAAAAESGAAAGDDHVPPAPPSISGEPPDPMPLGVDAIVPTPVRPSAAEGAAVPDEESL